MLLCIAAILSINQYVVSSSDHYILSEDKLPSAGWVVVLGAQAYQNDEPSPALATRVDKAVELFNIGRVDGLLLTGGESNETGREATAMKNYAMRQGVGEEFIVTDGTGLNTHASIKWVHYFTEQDPKPVIIVTQKFHLNRAVYMARKLGLKAYGVAAEDAENMGLPYLKFRELFARVKDFFLIMKK